MGALFTLEGRTAIVTGGASGMGFGIATAYCEAGANVVIADINEAVAAEAAEKLCSQGLSGHRGAGGCDGSRELPEGHCRREKKNSAWWTSSATTRGSRETTAVLKSQPKNGTGSLR